MQRVLYRITTGGQPPRNGRNGMKKSTIDVKYCVADNNGNLAGHDLDRNHAEQVLDEMIQAKPIGEWEIIEQS